MAAKKDKKVEEAVKIEDLPRPRVTTTKNMTADIADLVDELREKELETNFRMMGGIDEIEKQRVEAELKETAEVIDKPYDESDKDQVVVRTNATFRCSIGGKWYQFVKNQPQLVNPNVRQVLEEAGKLR
jgi:hypothetical protein